MESNEEPSQGKINPMSSNPQPSARPSATHNSDQEGPVASLEIPPPAPNRSDLAKESPHDSAGLQQSESVTRPPTFRAELSSFSESSEPSAAPPVEKSNENEDNNGDVFGNEEGNGIQYKTLGWKLTGFLMISEVVSNGVLALPSGAAVIGIVPTVIIVLFLGVLGTFSGILLVQFKVRYPHIHSVGDAGEILFGKVGGEIFFWGATLFTILAQGSHILAGTFALSAFSHGKLCMTVSAAIFLVPCVIFALPRKLSQISYLGVISASSILLGGVVGMIGAGLNPALNRTVSIAASSSFYNSFVAITSPVFAFAGHFIFFALISEMHSPKDATKSIYLLQGFSTTFYVVFVIVMYVFLGNDVASPSFNSLPTSWRIAAYAVALPSFIISAMLAAHVAVKQLFIKYFRNTKYSHWITSNDTMGWIVWTLAILVVNGVGFLLAVAIPIFNLLLGLTASLFASWYSYAFSGMFGLYMLAKDVGSMGNMWRRRGWLMASCVGILVIGGFIFAAGTYTSIRGIIDEYKNGNVGKPFRC